MARRPSFLVTPWLFTLVQTATLAYNLPTNISDFVPSCAAECFNSFVYVSYSRSSCAHDRSLQCLCSQVGATGFTMGEGALQCILAEKSIGFCSDTDASDDVVYNAYSMCEDQPDAVTPTHKVITATLVMPTTGGVITFPPVETTSTTMTGTPTTSLVLSSFSTLPTTLVMETSSSPLVSSTTRSYSNTRTRSSSRSSTFTNHSRTTRTTESTTSMSSAITLRPTTTSSTSTTETSSATPGAAANGDKKDDDGLSKNQIAGISVGVLATAGLAIAAILLARYYRKKKYPKIKTGFLPNRNTLDYKHTRSNSGGTNSWIAHQARRSLDPFPPPPAPTHNRSSHRPGTIGLAISPANSRVVSHTQPSIKSRRMSRLLPAKPVLPVLPLNIIKRNSQSQAQDEWPVPNVHYGGPSRKSNPPQLPPLEIDPAASVTSPTGSKTMPPAPPRLQIPDSNVAVTAPQTQQQNTRESTMTEFEEDERTSLPTTQVWRPPPTTPISAKTIYVADKYGHWKLADPVTAAQLAQSQPPVPRPLPKDDAYVQPSRKGKEKAGEARSVSPLSDESPNGGLAAPAEIVPGRSQSIQKPMGPRVQQGSALSSLPSQRRNSASRYSLGRSLTRPRMSGSSDATTITTSSEDTPIDPSPALEPPGNLSPVQESPNSSKGRSPVSYPQIPTRDLNRLTVSGPQDTRAAPPPSRQMVYYPRGQPSPTLGNPNMPSQWFPKSGRRSIANPGLVSTGSPTMRIVEPSPEPEEQAPAPPPKPRAPPFFFAPHYPQPLDPRQASQHHRMAPDSRHQSDRPVPQQPPPQRQPPYVEDPYSQQQYPQQQYHRQQYPQKPYPPQQYPQQQQRYSQQQRTQQQPYQPYQPRQPRQPRQPQQQYPQDPNLQERCQSQRHSTHSQQHHQWHPLRTSQLPGQAYRKPQTSDNTASGSSSLLAKRLGDDRAANMAIPTSTSQPKWRRDDGSPAGQTREPGPSEDPAWVPRLTPTRRGDDLFLNVQ